MTGIEMNRSRLVQRLNKPRNYESLGFKDNPFNFGGGLKNGGLSDEAMGLLRGIFQFDYMGASEYEWGAVPEALSKIAGRKDLVAFTISIPIREVEKYWRDDSTEEPEGEATVYVLAPAEHREEIERRINEWGRKEPRHPADFKEVSHFSLALRPAEDWHRRTVGWLELDNGFLFTIDEEMFEQTCALFGVVVPESGTVKA